MPSENVHPTAVASSKDEAFNYQMEFLKLEFQAINEVIGRIDETAAKVKNWAVVTWAGSMALALGRTNDLKKYLWITAVPSFLLTLCGEKSNADSSSAAAGYPSF
jgi:uncharacterized membrane protein